MSQKIILHWSRNIIARHATFVILSVLAAFMLVTPYVTAETASTDARVTTAKRFIDTYKGYGLSGAFIVAENDEVLFHTAVGWADSQRGLPITRNTYFDIGSITKTITGAAILHLEADGQLHTSDRISRYLGEFPANKSAVTIHHLATHKGGLVVRGEDVATSSLKQFVKNMKSAPREAEPGSEYRYTNAGISLLAAVVEVASGQSFENYVREHLLIPTGTEHMMFDTAIVKEPIDVAIGYGGTTTNTVVEEPVSSVWGNRGAGGMYARVHDVYKWVAAIRDSSVLPKHVKDKLFDPSETEAYGWHDQMIDERRIIHKGGQTQFFASQVLFYPESDLIIVWAVNDNRQRWRTLLNDGLTNIFHGGTVDIPPEVVSNDEQVFQQIIGSYRTSNGEEILFEGAEYSNSIFAVGETNCLPNNATYFPVGNGRFAGFDGRDGSQVLIALDDKGRVVESHWRSDKEYLCRMEKQS